MSHIYSSDALQPIVFAILAGLTPDEYEIEFYDERIERIPENLKTDLIAITVETYTAKRSYQLALNYKNKGIKVVMGGFHPTSLPDEALQFADSVVIGEAENIWNILLDDLKSGNLKKKYISDKITNLANLKFDHSIFKDKKYPKIIPVQFSRGCNYNCSFCSIKAFYGEPRYRPIEDVIEEIKREDSKIFFFVDDNIFFDKKIVIKLFNNLKLLKIKWSAQASIDIVEDDEILKLAAESGCIALIIGFESFNIDNLKLMNKNQNIKCSNYEMIINKIKNHGIMIYGTFILGYDNDRASDFMEYLEFALKNKLFLANFNPLIPMPGTKLYEQLKKENRLLFEKWWIDDLYKYGDSLFIPKKIKENELKELCYKLRKEFNSFFNIIKRAVDFKANCHNYINLMTYLVCNFISKKQIKIKQGKLLGIKNENYFN